MDSSFSTCNCRLNPVQNRSGHSNVQGSQGGGASQAGGCNWPPLCWCGDPCVLRIFGTDINPGKRFWGCRHYKKWTTEGWCRYHEWYIEDVADAKNIVILT